MQISPAFTHSHQLRDSLVDAETPAISNCVFETLVHCSFKEKILSNKKRENTANKMNLYMV